MNTNLSRRDFLKSSVIAASGLAILPNWLAAQEVPKSKMQISAQMYSVRGDCGANFDNALEKVAKMGFQGVEFAGYYNYGNKPAELKKRLDDLGIKASGTHIGTGSFDKNNLQRTIDFHAAIGCKFLVVP
ncbi:MAG: TIM barrel protein, partial [Victivallales bacterium]|nr:TIM barrel protein [Victivallales bacterium]